MHSHVLTHTILALYPECLIPTEGPPLTLSVRRVMRSQTTPTTISLTALLLSPLLLTSTAHPKFVLLLPESSMHSHVLTHTILALYPECLIPTEGPPLTLSVRRVMRSLTTPTTISLTALL